MILPHGLKPRGCAAAYAALKRRSSTKGLRGAFGRPGASSYGPLLLKKMRQNMNEKW